MRILILGCNGFIGTAITKQILLKTDWSVVGLDLFSFRLGEVADHPRFTFICGDLRNEHSAINHMIANCDVMLPLAAYATPATYLNDPLGTFELDFVEILRIVKQAASAGCRIIFPSSSEVYGMCPDDEFDEHESQLVLGPIRNHRWIYSCSKQLLDRVIWALGDQGLDFTIFRPFNWFGFDQDDSRCSSAGSSRVIPQFIGHLMRSESIALVDGGHQKRTFTFIDDGIDALMRILENRNGIASKKIINIGNPANFFSIRELADLLIEELGAIPGCAQLGARASICETSGMTYYGRGYEDVKNRRPRIDNALELGWKPQIGMREGLRAILDNEIKSGRWNSFLSSPTAPTVDSAATLVAATTPN
jgi:nucleoside-diphosphate-sugar epimerase